MGNGAHTPRPALSLLTKEIQSMTANRGIYIDSESRRAVVLSTLENRRRKMAQVIGVEPEELLTATELADLLGVSNASVYSWRKQGRIQAYGKERMRYYIRGEVMQALELAGSKA